MMTAPETTQATDASVLIVEDDPITAARIASGLHLSGFRVTTTVTVAEARNILANLPPDLVVLDIGLPDGSGLELIREARQRGTGVMCVSALGAVEDRMAALKLGADDYMVKPAANEELAVKLRNLLTRIREARGQDDPQRVFIFEGWTCEPLGRRLTSPAGDDVVLTPGEFDVLQVFLANPGICLARDRLIDLAASEEKIVNDRAVDIMVHRLRKKIEADAKSPRIFVTVYGVGYIFAVPVDTASVMVNGG